MTAGETVALFDVGGLEPTHLVGTGGAIGAIARYWFFLHLPSDRFPTATLAVNALGSFLLGVVVFAGPGESALHFLGTGLCGSFTTFSTFSVETVQLWERGDRRLALASAGSNLLVSLAMIGAAWLLVVTVGP